MAQAAPAPSAREEVPAGHAPEVLGGSPWIAFGAAVLGMVAVFALLMWIRGRLLRPRR